MSKSLLKISVGISPEAEEAVVELMSTLFQIPASIYTDTERHTTRAIVYVDAFTASQRSELRAGLREIRAAGLEIGSGRSPSAACRGRTGRNPGNAISSRWKSAHGCSSCLVGAGAGPGKDRPSPFSTQV